MAEEPTFYTPEADTADVVRCLSGHLMQRETAQFVGQMVYAKWACPYCIYTEDERQVAFRARDVALKGH